MNSVNQEGLETEGLHGLGSAHSACAVLNGRGGTDSTTLDKFGLTSKKLAVYCARGNAIAFKSAERLAYLRIQTCRFCHWLGPFSADGRTTWQTDKIGICMTLRCSFKSSGRA